MSATYNNLNQITSRGGGGNMPVQGKVSRPANVSVNGKAASVDTNNGLPWTFWAQVPVTVGTNQFSIVAKDGGGNSITNQYQIVVSGGASGTYQYDLNGNLLSDGARTYTWDAENRLKSVTSSSSTSIFTYDGQGRRVKEYVNGTLTKQWIWNGNTIVEERNASNVTTKRFFSQGEQIGGTNYYYTRDHLGSVREMNDSSGNIVARYAYDAYGRATKLTGTMDSDFQYTGHYFHAASGLNLTLYRAYDPDTGRWQSRDPLDSSTKALIGLKLNAQGLRITIAERSQGPNLYAYVKNIPIKFTDQLGLACGSGWNDAIIPDGDPLFGWRYDFTPACQQHDACYDKCGASKDSCDMEFYQNMRSICNEQSPGRFTDCAIQARMYYWAVKIAGKSAFDAAQEKCKCKNK